MEKINQRSTNNLKGVHPDLVKLLSRAIEDAPFEFTIVEGVRTKERQWELYGKGRTEESKKKGEKIVTNCDGMTKRSNHQAKKDGYGHAVDLYAHPIDVTDTIRIKILADHIKRRAIKLNIPIEWGGDWKMRDYPHFELKNK